MSNEREILTVEMSTGTSRRLEMMGFSHDLNGRDVVRFLIEEGLGVLEKHRGTDNCHHTNRSGLMR